MASLQPSGHAGLDGLWILHSVRLEPVIEGAEARDGQAQAWWDRLAPADRYALFRALGQRFAHGAD